MYRGLRAHPGPVSLRLHVISGEKGDVPRHLQYAVARKKKPSRLSMPATSGSMSAARRSMTMSISAMPGRSSRSTPLLSPAEAALSARHLRPPQHHDIDDKIMTRASENKEPIEQLTDRTAAAHQSDMVRLGALPPDAEPRATQYVGQMVAIIERLIERGHAYAAEGHVLFSVPSMSDYGRLSRVADELIAGRAPIAAPYKKDPLTSCCSRRPRHRRLGESVGRGQSWLVHRGSAMSAHLGETFDIHAGWPDLTFPHQRMRSRRFARPSVSHHGEVLMHNGFLNISGEKMSKSLGNFFTARAARPVSRRGDPPAAVMRTSPAASTSRTRGLTQAKATLDRWYGACGQGAEVAVPVPPAVEDAPVDDVPQRRSPSALGPPAPRSVGAQGRRRCARPVAQDE